MGTAFGGEVKMRSRKYLATPLAVETLLDYGVGCDPAQSCWDAWELIHKTASEGRTRI